jgi:hypothetical protein
VRSKATGMINLGAPSWLCIRPRGVLRRQRPSLLGPIPVWPYRYMTACEVLVQSFPVRVRHLSGYHCLHLSKSATNRARDRLARLRPYRHERQRADARASQGLDQGQTRHVLMCCPAHGKVRTFAGVRPIDIKLYTACCTRVEKVPGGEIEDSRVLSRIMLNKNIAHGAPTDALPHAQAADRAR